jgi:hypothetical protein
MEHLEKLAQETWFLLRCKCLFNLYSAPCSNFGPYNEFGLCEFCTLECDQEKAAKRLGWISEDQKPHIYTSKFRSHEPSDCEHLLFAPANIYKIGVCVISDVVCLECGCHESLVLSSDYTDSIVMVPYEIKGHDPIFERKM